MSHEQRVEDLAALSRWLQRYPVAAVRDLGFLLLDIARTSALAEIGLRKAIDCPAHVREATEADAEMIRLRERIERFNIEVGMLRGRAWPD